MHVAYDTETFPNVHTCLVSPMDRDEWWVYEISERRNDAPYLYHDLTSLRFSRMYGFNNLSYDYPLLHFFCKLYHAWDGNLSATAITAALYQESLRLISADWGKGWQNRIRHWEQHVPQVDLMLLNHFDNHAKITNLKDLEFNLECENVAEMPFEYGRVLTPDEIPVLIGYNWNDTHATKQFALKCKDAIEFRETLIADGTFPEACLNWNDVKLGEKFFIKRLEERSPGITAYRADGSKPQTFRSNIRVADIILPYIQFERPELKNLIERLRDTTVDGAKTKNAYKFKVPLDGVEIHIGAGGIHGSLDRHTVRADTGNTIIDIDVEGYYPSVAIVNAFYPEHIGPIFIDVYRSIRDDRAAAKKIAALFAKAGILKLSNNGAFGKTNDQHSVLFDPRCMLAITINGQLLQCVLAESLLRVPGLRILQLNTDGITVSLPRNFRQRFDDICAWWQRQTCLKLEFTEYQAMWLRDVNNYLAQDIKGKIKRKGKYDHEMVSGSIGGQKAWNKDFSALVVPKAAEAALIDDIDPSDFIANHDRLYDFLLRERAKGGAHLESGHSGTKLGKLVRYYVAKSGEPLVKVFNDGRRIGIHAEGQADAIGGRKDYRCSMCGERFVLKSSFDEHNKQRHAYPIKLKMHWDGDLSGIDHGWYVKETEKLLF